MWKPTIRRGSPSDLAFLVASAVVGLSYAIVFWREAHSGLEYDEAYNLQLVSSLAAGDGYATFGALQGQDHFLFDPFISTGPVMIAPGVIPWMLGSGYSWMMRLVPLAFFTLLVTCLYGFTRQFWGRWLGLAVAATPLLLNVGQPDLVTSGLVPGRYIGEFAALGLLVAAAWAGANGRIGLAALLAGLSCQTKSVFVIGGAILLSVCWIADWVANRRPDWAGAARGAAGALGPTLVFEIYRFASLGSWGAYNESLDTLSSFLDSQSEDPLFKPERFGSMAELLTEPGMAVLAVAAVLGVAAAFWPPASSGQPSGEQPSGEQQSEAATEQTSSAGGKNALGKNRAALCWASLLAFGFVLLYLWFWRSTQGSHRQVLAFVMVAYPVAILAAAELLARAWPRVKTIAGVVMALAMAAISLGQGVAAWNYRGADIALDDQRAAAQAIMDSGTPTIGMYGVWFQSPEYQLLTGIPHDQSAGAPASTVDIFTDLMAVVLVDDPNADARTLQPRCIGEVLYSSKTVVVCRR